MITFSWITKLGNSVPYLIVSTLFFLWAFFIIKNKRLAWMAVYILLSIVVSGILCDILKIVFSRARPNELFSDQMYGLYFWQFHSGFWSLPSGHVTTIAALSTAGYFLLPRFLWAFMFLFISVALSRIIVQAHYLSDVMVGAYLGFAISVWLYSLFIHKVQPAFCQSNA